MKPNHSHKLLFIFAILCLAFTISIYVYMQVAISTFITQAAEAKNAAELEKKSHIHERELTGFYDATAGQWAKIDSMVVPAGKIVLFIESLESLGIQSGSEVEISSIDTSASADSAGLSYVTAKVEASGSWQSIMKTLKLAELMQYKTEIKDVRLVGSGEAGKKLWNLSFNIKALTLK